MSSLILTITAGILFGIILSAGYLGVTANKTINKPEVDVSDASTAYFAGGCFWCTEAAYEQLDGVLEVVSGYANGHLENPTYDEVTSGNTGHKEAVVIYYNKSKISYEELVENFWENINPTDEKGQFGDKGSQYKTAIFYQNENEKQIAEQSKKQLNASGKFQQPIVTEILPLTAFYEAEEYHQDYYLKNEQHYKSYKFFSGRTKYFKELWGDEEMKKEESTNQENAAENLTKLQYDVTKNSATEKPFENEYWDNKAEGIYVDLFSGKPLFSSTDKYDSGTGWPSFTKPIDSQEIIKETDYKIGIARTEVRSESGDAHLGHVFNDGPAETGGERYCINSAAMRFIPKEEMKSKGYEEYLYLFE